MSAATPKAGSEATSCECVSILTQKRQSSCNTLRPFRRRFALIRSLVNADVYEEGDEKDFTLHDTLYRYLVLFGVPSRFGSGDAEKVSVWEACEERRAKRRCFQLLRRF